MREDSRGREKIAGNCRGEPGQDLTEEGGKDDTDAIRRIDNSEGLRICQERSMAKTREEGKGLLTYIRIKRSLTLGERKVKCP